MLKSNRPYTPSLALLLAGIALSGPATLLAGVPTNAVDEVPTVHVNYAGLDLSTQAGAAILYRRLKSAAQQVCGSSVDNRQLSLRAQWNACYEKALSDAVAHVNRPQVTALYRSQRHGSMPG